MLPGVATKAEIRARLRRAARAYNRRKDLDPAKKERDLGGLPPETRRRVENYRQRAHL
jgi:hypothetical protein